MNARVLRALVLAALLASPAGAAVVRLRDGSVLRGTVVSATARELQLHTEGGTLTIAADRILRVDYDEPATGTAPSAPAYGEAPKPSRPAWMDEDDGRHTLGFDMGFAVPMSEVSFVPIGGTDTNGDVSAYFGGYWLYELAPAAEAGLSVEYLHRGPSDSRQLIPNASASAFGGSLVLLAMAKATAWSDRPVRPYLKLGLGGHRTTVVVDAQPEEGFVWTNSTTDEVRRLVDGRDWGPAGTVRLGVDFRAAAPSVFALEAGWNALWRGRYPATSAGRAIGLEAVHGPLHVLTIGGRWGWRF